MNERGELVPGKLTFLQIKTWNAVVPRNLNPNRSTDLVLELIWLKKIRMGGGLDVKGFNRKQGGPVRGKEREWKGKRGANLEWEPVLEFLTDNRPLIEAATSIYWKSINRRSEIEGIIGRKLKGMDLEERRGELHAERFPASLALANRWQSSSMLKNKLCCKTKRARKDANGAWTRRYHWSREED